MPFRVFPDVDSIKNLQGNREKENLKAFNLYSGQLKSVSKREEGTTFVVRRVPLLKEIVAQWVHNGTVTATNPLVAKIDSLTRVFVTASYKKLSAENLLPVWNGVKVPQERIEGEGQSNLTTGHRLLLEACLELKYIRGLKGNAYVIRNLGVAFPQEVQDWRDLVTEWIAKEIGAAPGENKADFPSQPDVDVSVPWYPERRAKSRNSRGSTPEVDLEKEENPGKGLPPKKNTVPPPTPPPPITPPRIPVVLKKKPEMAKPKLSDYDHFTPFVTRPEIFVTNFKTVATLQGYKEDADSAKAMFKIFATRMKDSAAVWIQKEPEVTTMDQWKTFLEKFTKRWNPFGGDEAQLRVKWNTMKPKEGELTSEYLKELAALGAYCHKDEAAIVQKIKDTAGDLETMYLRNAETIDDCWNELVTLEIKQGKNPNQPPSGISPNPGFVMSIQETGGPMRPAGAIRIARGFSGECAVCGETGHKFRECKFILKFQQLTSRDRSEGGQGGRGAGRGQQKWERRDYGGERGGRGHGRGRGSGNFRGGRGRGGYKRYPDRKDANRKEKAFEVAEMPRGGKGKGKRNRKSENDDDQ